MLKQIFKSKFSGPPPQSFSVAGNERLYVVGDIHGRDDLLVQMLKYIIADLEHFKNDQRTARVIFLGDYIDRGDNSKGVIDCLSALATQDDLRFEFLIGNHEAALLHFASDPLAGRAWLNWGGRQTLTSYGLPPVSREPETAELLALHEQMVDQMGDHLEFLNSLDRYTTSGDIICAHASLTPEAPLEKQPDSALLWGRLPPGQESGFKNRLLIHGHFAAYEPVVHPNRICVDTGAFYSGRLTAVRLDQSMHFIHADTQDLMP